MNYKECYEMILDNFKNKINTDDKLLKMKIFNNLVNWYKNNYEETLKNHFKNNNNLAIISTIKMIEDVCRLTDYEKLQMVYLDDNFEKFIQLSNHIFSLVSSFINDGEVQFDDEIFNKYVDDIENYEQTISEIFKDKYNYYKSECILDLKYLKNKGNVSSYSLRTHRLLSEQNK